MAAPGFANRTAQVARRLAGATAMAATVGAVALAALPAADASAAVAPRGAVVRLVHPAGQRMVPARVISCRIGVVLRFPHPITAVGVVRCSAIVPRIALKVRLFRNGAVIRHRLFSKAFVRTLKGSVSMPCLRGTYQAVVNGAVRLRSGRIITGHALTRRIRVVC